MEKLDIIAQISDLKELDYQNTLAVATLIELLIEKKIFTKQEFAKKAYDLDQLSFHKSKINTGTPSCYR